MFDATIHGVGIDVISARRFEVTVLIGAYRPGGVAECAADVDVDVVEVDNESGVVAAPGALDHQIGGRCGRRGRASERREDQSESRDAVHIEYARFQPMTAQLGLGMAALGRPGYVTLDHASALGGNYDPAAMEAHAHEVLDAAYDAGVRYFDMARSYGRAEEFFASWVKQRRLKPGDVVVASKWGYTYTADWKTSAEHHEIKDHSLATYTRQLAESLERLDGYLSRYQIHSVTAESKTLDDDALIDAIARLKEKGIRPGITTSGPGQAVAIRKCLHVRRDGELVFDSVQATWNLLERSAESALSEAHDAGVKVIIKEALANGRLTEANVDEQSPLSRFIARLRTIAHSNGQTLETLALGVALNRPWANVVLSGAATVDQLASNARAREFSADADLEHRLHEVTIEPADYWNARSGFAWN